MKIEVHLYDHRSQEAPRPAWVDEMLAAINRLELKMSQELDDLEAEVARNTSVDESALALINGLAAQLTTLADQLAQAGVDAARVIALRDSLAASSNALAAAVAANTPAAPPPTP